jgi:hypothetical protein
MPRNPDDFDYYYSEILKQEVALSKKSGWTYCTDKGPDGKFVSYSPKELQILGERGGTLTPEVHRIKKLFGGEVIANVDRTGNMDRGKSEAGNESINTPNNPDTGGKIPEAPGGRPQGEQIELDIY